ncbi:hypothetical protein SynSYN20_00235 [Synechococcus sp. SYN20]|nr:hypothetical protein SynSYN20_00235 [Synechococcus sp. SYN20]
MGIGRDQNKLLELCLMLSSQVAAALTTTSDSALQSRASTRCGSNHRHSST